MTFNEVDFVLAFAISFSDRTFHLQSRSGLLCGEQNLLYRLSSVSLFDFFHCFFFNFIILEPLSLFHYFLNNLVIFFEITG